MTLGRPRVHLRRTGSTNDHARDLALADAPHGTLVTADVQSAGRGRQGRAWTAPAGRALLASVLLREPPPLLSLAAAVAVARACGPNARIKWPNDVLVDGRKVAGILVEARPQHGWAVLGVGINVAVRVDDFPPELRGRAGTLGRAPEEREAILRELLAALEEVLMLPDVAVLESWRARDALLGREVRWRDGRGTAAGIDEAGRLLVVGADGHRTPLDAGEVHLGAVGEDAATAPGSGPAAGPDRA